MTEDQPEQIPGNRGLKQGHKSSELTLERLQKIAQLLRPLKWVSLFGLVVSVIAFTFSVIEAHLDRYIIPSVVGGMWAMLMFAFISGFQVIPARPPDGGSISERMTAQIARGAYWLLAILTGAASLGAVVLTFRLLVIWSSEHGG